MDEQKVAYKVFNVKYEEDNDELIKEAVIEIDVDEDDVEHMLMEELTILNETNDQFVDVESFDYKKL